MRVTQSSQTLILAGERAPPRSTDVASSNAVLQRVTMMATRPDDTVVYIRADYSPGSDVAFTNSNKNSASAASAESAGTPQPSIVSDSSVASTASAGFGSGASAVVPLVTSRSLLPSSSRDVYGNSRTSNRGAEEYARTQRILAATQEFHYLDVLA